MSARGVIMQRSVTAALAGIAAVAVVPSTAAAAPRVVTVSSITQLQSATDAAQPGDRIELVNGTYTTSGAITLRRSGNSSARITIAAQNVGGAEIRGSNGFSFADADYVTVEGFRLRHGGGLSVPAGSHHVRITRNVVQLTSSSGTGSRSPATTSRSTTTPSRTRAVRACSSRSPDPATPPWPNARACTTTTSATTPSAAATAASPSGSATATASSARPTRSSSTNLFERANGDSEAISVKSSDNTVRHNTIRDSRGSIVLRHGNRNLVEGNLMLGNTAGLRFYDNDHVLINNVIQGGTGQVIAGSGDVADDTTGSTSHARPDRVLVAFNTVVSDRTNVLQVGQGTDRLGPNQCTFADNIFVGSGSGAVLDIDEGTGLTWQGNIVWAGTGGNVPSSGYRVVNPALTTDAGGLRRLTSGSPAVNAAVGSYSQVSRDMDLQNRSGTKDIGADEYASSGPQRRSLTTSDVGPNA